MVSKFYLVHHHFKPGIAAPWWGEMGKLDEAANEKMTQNWLVKGSLHESGFSIIEKYMMGQ